MRETKKALDSGEYLHIKDNLKVHKVTAEDRRKAEAVVEYVETTLLPVLRGELEHHHIF